MKRLLISGLSLAMLCGCAAWAETAAEWAGKNADTLAKVNDQTIAETLKQGQAGFDKLAAQIKTNYEIDPAAATTIAAITQYVMRHPEVCPEYANRLLAAAKAAKEPDMICFWLNQLRWCGGAELADQVKPFTTAQDKGVADFAKMVVQSLTRNIELRAPAPETRAAALSRELDALPPNALAPRLVKFVDDPDIGCVRVALARGVDCGPDSTPLWIDAFQTQPDPERKVMLADLLGNRGDPAAVPALTAALADNGNLPLVEAAADALFKLNRSALVAALPDWMKRATPEQYGILRAAAKRFTTAEAAAAMQLGFKGASETGQRVALEFFQERQVSALALGLAAIENKNPDVVIAGYRMLRETAGPGQAETLVKKMITTEGRITPEAQNAVAAAARRDQDGTYRKVVLGLLNSVPDAQRQTLLEVAARIGGDDLLKAVISAADSDNADTSVAAVRTLSAWDGDASVPELMKLAVAAKTPKAQTLALRGVSKKFNDKTADPTKFVEAWKAVKALKGNEENKKELSQFFSMQINVALKKKISANVPTEGNNIPENLVDGNVKTAWFGHASPAAATIDLGAVEKVNSCHVVFFHDGRAYTFNVELSEDGKTWKKVCGNEDNVQPATAEGLRYNFELTAARYARLNVIKNTANQAVHVYEFELFKPGE